MASLVEAGEANFREYKRKVMRPAKYGGGLCMLIFPFETLYWVTAVALRKKGLKKVLARLSNLPIKRFHLRLR